MTQAFYDVLAIKPTYLGITLFPYSIILKPWHASDSFPVKNDKSLVYIRKVSSYSTGLNCFKDHLVRATHTLNLCENIWEKNQQNVNLKLII